MRPPVLFGEYELTIDDKNRLLIPSDVRKSIDPALFGEAFFLIVGANRLPWLYPERYYEEEVAAAPLGMNPDEDKLAYAQMQLSMATKLSWDKQGRILVPDKYLRRTGLTKDVTLIGVQDHLELWNRADWEARWESLFNRSSEIALKAKQASKQDSP